MATSEIQQRLASITQLRQRGTALLQKCWNAGELSELPCSQSCTGYIGVETPEGYVRGTCPAYMQKGTCPLVEKVEKERHARLSQAGFGRHYHSPDLARIRARRAVEEFLANSREHITSGRGMVITGDVGVGKTMMLAYLAAKMIDQGHGVWKVHAPELVEGLEDSKTQRRYVQRAISVEVFMVDDLGSGAMSDEVLGILERIVEHRYANQKPMFVSTNMTRKQLVENVPLRRMVDRWREMNMMVRIAGESQRHM